MRKVQFISTFLLTFVIFLSAAEKRPMNFIDLLEVPVIGQTELAPDGSKALFRKSVANWEKNRQEAHICLADFKSGDYWQVTRGSGSEGDFAWALDGKSFAFCDKRGKDEHRQIYLLSLKGGEAFRLTKHATDVSDLTFSPEGKWIYFLALDPESEKEKQDKKQHNDVYAFEQNLKQRHLWRVEVKTGKEEQITKGDFSVFEYHLSRDGNRIVFTRAKSRIRDEADLFREIWLMQADGKKVRQITRNSISEHNVYLSPDGQRILFISWCNEKLEPYYNNNLFLIDLKNNQIELQLADMPYEVLQARWSKDGRKIYFLANMGVHVELFTYDLKKKKLNQLTDGKHSLKSWDFLPEKELHLFSVDTPENAGDLWLFTRAKKWQRITHIFDYLQERFFLPKKEAITWKGEDGVTVEGLLTYPLHYQKGKKYALAVLTHGGPRSADRFGFGRWREYVPVLAAHGYVVLEPNYRGSTGYGDEFLRDMVGHYFHQAHRDVMAGVDYLISIGLVDSSRMVTGGWSAGGHMTNKLITFTNRFKAASSGAGAVNWISMYGQSDTRSQRTPWFGGTPWQKDAPIQNYWENSPLKDIYKVKTPTIIFVGEEDPRVPMPQSVELYRALKSNGVSTVLYVAPREKHGWRELRHRLFKMNAEFAWFEKYVHQKDFKWITVPESKE